MAAPVAAAAALVAALAALAAAGLQLDFGAAVAVYAAPLISAA